MKKDSIRSLMVTMPLNAQGRHLYEELQCPRLVESNVMPSASISVPRSEAGLGTAPPWPARPVGKTCDSVGAGHAGDGHLDYLA